MIQNNNNNKQSNLWIHRPSSSIFTDNNKKKKKKNNKRINPSILSSLTLKSQQNNNNNDDGSSTTTTIFTIQPKQTSLSKQQQSSELDNQSPISSFLQLLIHNQTTVTTSGTNDMNNNKKKSNGKRKQKKNNASRKQQQQNLNKMNTDNDDWIPILGFYGMYPTPSGYLWVVITNSTPVLTDCLPWGTIYRIKSMECIFMPHKSNNNNNMPSSSSSSRQRRDDDEHIEHQDYHEEMRQIKLLRQAIKSHEFYYSVPPSSSSSSSFVVPDMTWSLQRCFTQQKSNVDNNHDDGVQFVRPDARFYWNQPVAHHLESHPLLRPHVIPVTSAFVSLSRHAISTTANTTTTNNENNASSTTTTYHDNKLFYHEMLVARRSRFRAGTRFTKRGADARGHCANYVETEQILLILQQQQQKQQVQQGLFKNQPVTASTGIADNVTNNIWHIASHVQTRGSIPLRWSSPTDVKTYRPRVRIGVDPMAHATALVAHLNQEWSHYVLSSSSQKEQQQQPKLVFCNLIDKQKDQGRLGRAFGSVLRAVLDVFDISGKDKNETKMMSDEEADSSQTVLWTDNMTSSKNVSRAAIMESLTNQTTTTTQSNNIEQPPWAQKSSSPHDNIKHIWYDFHAQVKKRGKWNQLQTLLYQIEPMLTQHGYFHMIMTSKKQQDKNNDNDYSVRVVRQQSGVVRTNCMDCLDRTNVVQSMFGRYMLHKAIQSIQQDNINDNNKKSSDDNDKTIKQTIPTKKNTKKKKNKKKSKRLVPLLLTLSFGEMDHRLLWADHADAISRLYAGTRALKGDFTRTGQRTKRGALDDGMNSLSRFYLNNFMDADRQEGMDLLVGHASFATTTTTTNEMTSHTKQTRKANDDFFLSKANRLRWEASLGTTTDDDDYYNYNHESNNDESEDNDDDNDDKVKRKNGPLASLLYGASPLRFVDGGGSGGGGRMSARLRWLPGDLQSHVKAKPSRVWHRLLELDRRAASPLPWWVVSTTNDDEDDDNDKSNRHDKPDEDGAVMTRQEEEKKTTNKNADQMMLFSLTSRHIGFIVASLVVAIQSPIMTAALIVVCLGIFLGE